jgi:hypothetical protein
MKDAGGIIEKKVQFGIVGARGSVQMGKEAFDIFSRREAPSRSFDVYTPFRQVEKQLDWELTVDRRIPNCLRNSGSIL